MRSSSITRGWRSSSAASRANLRLRHQLRDPIRRASLNCGAATPVTAYRPDLLARYATQPPTTWGDLLALASRERVPATRLGLVGGDAIRIAIDGMAVIDTPLADAERIWATSIESYFEASRAIA